MEQTLHTCDRQKVSYGKMSMPVLVVGCKNFCLRQCYGWTQINKHCTAAGPILTPPSLDLCCPCHMFCIQKLYAESAIPNFARYLNTFHFSIVKKLICFTASSKLTGNVSPRQEYDAQTTGIILREYVLYAKV
jgi:hypothetical protein